MRLQRFSSYFIGIAFVVSAHFFFGTTYACNKMVINQGLDPVLLGLLRMSLATVCFFPFYLKTRSQVQLTRNDWLTLLFVGMLAQAAAIVFEYTANSYTTASNVAIVLSTDVISTVFLSVLILHEKLTWAVVLGGLLSLTGVGLVMLDDIRQFTLHGGQALLGDCMVLVAVLCWSCYTIGSKKILLKLPIAGVLFWVSLFTTLGLSIVTLCKGNFATVSHQPLNVWLIVVYLGICCSGLGHFCYYAALNRLPTVLVALSLTLPPVFGVAFAIAILNESLTWTQALGAVLILTGLTYAMWPRVKSSQDLQ